MRIGDNMPEAVGDIGFPIELHPRDPDTAWVFPMDGTDVWPRTSPEGRPAVYVTRDAGQSWTRGDVGLPSPAWFTVKRQAMTVDATGSTIDEMLQDLDRQFPGLRFRVVDEQHQLRQHMRVFINNDMARDLTTPIDPTDEITLMQALSGG